MTVIIESRIDGLFEGYEDGRSHRLTCGMTWVQEDGRREAVFAESPRVRLLADATGAFALEVEGAGAAVRVALARCVRREWALAPRVVGAGVDLGL